MRKGFTLLELIITIGMFFVFTLVTTYLLLAILMSWSGEDQRASVYIPLTRGIEDMSEDLREACAVISASGTNELRIDRANSTFIYYLYNSNDVYPPRFDQQYYQLKKTSLSGGINGTFTYGNGTIILNDVLSPDTSALSYGNSTAHIDLSIRRKNESVRLRTSIFPRNL